MHTKNQLTSQVVGQHLLADLNGVDAKLLRNESMLVELFEKTLERAGFHVLKAVSHKFLEAGCGVTGVILLSESHASFHTYPEQQYIALDIFSCGDAEPQMVLDTIVEKLQPGSVTTSVHLRG